MTSCVEDWIDINHVRLGLLKESGLLRKLSTLSKVENQWRFVQYSPRRQRHFLALFDKWAWMKSIWRKKNKKYEFNPYNLRTIWNMQTLQMRHEIKFILYVDSSWLSLSQRSSSKSLFNMSDYCCLFVSMPDSYWSICHPKWLNTVTNLQ